MLDFLPNPSPYFISNETFCKRVIKELDDLGVQYSGSCTSYGYDIYFQVEHYGINYELNYHSHQSTGTPVGISVDTRTRHYVNIRVENIPFKQFCQINGHTLFNPLLWGKKGVKLNEEHSIYTSRRLSSEDYQQTRDVVLALDLIRLNMNKGQLKASFRNDNLLPFEILEHFEELFNCWSK
jgi:hypothetical protein